MLHFWDEVVVKIKAGNGGNGAVSFMSDPFNPKGGPDGGDGGDGGDIIFRASEKVYDLTYFSYHRFIRAQNGGNGGRNKRTGRSGGNLELDLPIGTLIYIWNQEKREFKKIAEFKKIGQTFLASNGGKGGLGNAHLKTVKNNAPKFAKTGEEIRPTKLRLVLKLIADVGLVGFPNAGKSTFLSVVSQAKPKIAEYPFTTLQPNLGVVRIEKRKIIIADIPGIIEGAHNGKGLGDKFLKHIERTKLLIFFVSAESLNPLLDYKTLHHELLSYDKRLLKKDYFLVLNKIDLNKDYKKIMQKLQKESGKKVIAISALKKENTNEVIKQIFHRI